MERKIIAYKDYFETFFNSLEECVQNKILYVLMLLETQDRIPLKFMRIIEDGLYELRIEYESNIYRIFFCFDRGSVVILFNCFRKKTQKTPGSEIEKAKKLKQEYYEHREE
ncbi:MAG: type II toxin-antitoxin system RelE/ParE family toxin [Tannerella sp.]|nr:type II toxin-antitoxin system RelE/ParE family toxin [Tannerella sp.]